VTYLAVILGVFTSTFFNDMYPALAIGAAGITAGYAFSYARRKYTNWCSRYS